MTVIDGSEKRWWHDDEGRHRMPDLRSTDYPRKFWDSDERAYHAHLDRHDELDLIPKPEEDDSETIKTLFEMINTAETSILTARSLINMLREKGC